MTTTDTTTTAPWTFGDTRSAYAPARATLIRLAQEHGIPTSDADPLPLSALLDAGYLRGERDQTYRVELVTRLLARTHGALLVRWAEGVCGRASARLGTLPDRCAPARLADVTSPDQLGYRAADLLATCAEETELHARRTATPAQQRRAYGATYGAGLRELARLVGQEQGGAPVLLRAA